MHKYLDSYGNWQDAVVTDKGFRVHVFAEPRIEEMRTFINGAGLKDYELDKWSDYELAVRQKMRLPKTDAMHPECDVYQIAVFEKNLYDGEIINIKWSWCLANEDAYTRIKKHVGVLYDVNKFAPPKEFTKPFRDLILKAYELFDIEHKTHEALNVNMYHMALDSEENWYDKVWDCFCSLKKICTNCHYKGNQIFFKRGDIEGVIYSMKNAYLYQGRVYPDFSGLKKDIEHGVTPDYKIYGRFAKELFGVEAIPFEKRFGKEER